MRPSDWPTATDTTAMTTYAHPMEGNVSVSQIYTRELLKIHFRISSHKQIDFQKQNLSLPFINYMFLLTQILSDFNFNIENSLLINPFYSLQEFFEADIYVVCIELPRK